MLKLGTINDGGDTDVEAFQDGDLLVLHFKNAATGEPDNIGAIEFTSNEIAEFRLVLADRRAIVRCRTALGR